MDISTHDDCEAYCRMLGHDVPFKYCRSVGNGLPCRRVADCWYTRFDVVAWLHEHYSPDQIEQITSPPSPKIASLLDLIEQARSVGKTDSAH
jgi:hypothetical protein